ncbi:MAG TPA: four helix bundle protein [Ferruginibacter sp.]|nr:four helix bundle protein [Ferruginibacter sp.]
MSYKKLEIWQLAKELTIEIHKISLTLPKFEQFEETQQIRKFLTYSLSSNDETIDHLETLFETQSLKDELLYNCLHQKLTELGKKLNNFLQAVERSHNEFQP